MEKKFVLGVFALLACAGCRQNPYPESSRFFVEEPKRVAPAPVADIDMPAVLDCDEGKTCSTLIRGYFGDTGSIPSLSFATNDGSGAVDGLPANATFDVDQENFAYTPDFSVVDPTKDPSHPYRILNLEVTLRKSGDKVTVFKHKTLLLVVRNTPHGFAIQGPTAPDVVTEGESLSGKLTIVSDDYPTGPFQVTLSGAPDGVTATVNSSDPHLFDLKFDPSYDTVSTSDPIDPRSGLPSKSFTIEYTVKLPNGDTLSATKALLVLDDDTRRNQPTSQGGAQ
ncbi:MAG: hypothetical protein JST04_00335 [Bdellovibrionales bacterium]|nr:hypothetical protein [Bdellovibrionales bacterium]